MAPIKKHPLIANIAVLQQWIKTNIHTSEPVDDSTMLQIAARYLAEVILDEYEPKSFAELLLKGLPPVTLNTLQDALSGSDLTEDTQYYNSLEIRKAAASVLGDQQLASDYAEAIADWLWYDDH